MHVCECCDFETKYKHVYIRHISSERHMKHQTHPESKPEPAFQCPHCPKKYTTRSSLSRHKRQCQPPAEPTNTDLLQRITDLESKLAETTQNHTTNHTTNTTNNYYINYLNTNCKDAMNITEFVESLVFTKDDILKFLTDYYDKVVAKLLIERLGKLPVTQRPLHCIPPTVDVCGSFVVKTDQDWIQESKTQLDTHIRDVEDDDEYARMTIPATIDEIRNKIYDAYEEKRPTEPQLESIRNRMISSGGTEGKIFILDHLLESRSLKLPSNTVICDAARAQMTPPRNTLMSPL